MKQIVIEVPAPTNDSRSLHEILVAVLREFGPRKHEALIESLGASKGHFSEVHAGKKHWPEGWIDYIVDHFDCRNEVANYYARRRRMRVCPPRQMPSPEWKRRVAYVLERHNGMGKAVLDEAMALPDDLFADDEEIAS